MPLHVDEETKQKTTRCPSDYRCLTGDVQKCCKILACLDGTLMFMQCLEDRDCSYKSELEERTICTCPVRKKIFDRYGI